MARRDESWRKTGEAPPAGHNGGPGADFPISAIVLAVGTVLGVGSAIYFNREDVDAWLSANNAVVDDLVEALVDALTKPAL